MPVSVTHYFVSHHEYYHMFSKLKRTHDLYKTVTYSIIYRICNYHLLPGKRACILYCLNCLLDKASVRLICQLVTAWRRRRR